VARTVTVLFSDIKDYTARTAATGRSGAIDLVQRHRELAGPIIRQRRGTIVKTMGDGLLVTFESATDAVLAGLEVQAAVAAQNGSAEAGEELQLRIAVASGEVIVEAGDVYGETVNLASRLQGVAGVGQVVLSGTTASLVNGREVAVESTGAVRLAGFESPVEVFVARAADRVEK
jgi:adenylate cyclase